MLAGLMVAGMIGSGYMGFMASENDWDASGDWGWHHHHDDDHHELHDEYPEDCEEHHEEWGGNSTES